MFARNVSALLLTQVVTFAMSIGASVITARVLGPSGKGVLSAFLVVVALAPLLLTAGLDSANIFFVGKGRHPKGVTIGNSLAFCSAVSLMGFLVVYFGRAFVGMVMPEGSDSSLYFLLVGLAISATLFVKLASGILVGEEKIATLCLVTLGQSAVSFGLLLLLLVVLSWDIVGALAAALGSAVAGAFLGWYFVMKRLTQPMRVSLSRLKESLAYGMKGQVGNVVQWSSYRLDVFIMALFLTAADVGWYAVAYTLAELLWYLPNAIRTALFPRTAASQDGTADSFTPFLCRQTVVFMFVGVLVAAVSVWFLIPLVFGPEYRAAVVPFYLLLPGVAALGPAKVLSADLLGRGFPLYTTVVSVVALIVTIVADLILIPRVGIAGAAIGSSIAYVCGAVLTVWFFLRVSKASLASLVVPRTDDLLAWKEFGLAALSVLASLRSAAADWIAGVKRRLTPLVVSNVGPDIRFGWFKKTIEGAIPASSTLKVLDAGAGGGRYAFFMASRYPRCTVIGIDLDERAVANCRRRQESECASNVEFRVGSLTDPIREAGFDFVYCIDVLEHILDDAAALRNLGSCVRCQGLLLLHVPQARQHRYFSRYKGMSHIGHVRDGYDPADLVQRLKAIGMEIVGVKTTFGCWGTVAWELWVMSRRYPLAALICRLPILAMSWMELRCQNSQGNGVLVLARRTSSRVGGVYRGAADRDYAAEPGVGEAL